MADSHEEFAHHLEWLLDGKVDLPIEDNVRFARQSWDHVVDQMMEQMAVKG